MANTDLVVIRRFGSEGEAQVIKSLLESAGFKCYMTNEYSTGVLPMALSSNSFSYGLCVEEQDVEAALNFLKAKPIKEE